MGTARPDDSGRRDKLGRPIKLSRGAGQHAPVAGLTAAVDADLYGPAGRTTEQDAHDMEKAFKAAGFDRFTRFASVDVTVEEDGTRHGAWSGDGRYLFMRWDSERATVGFTSWLPLREYDTDGVERSWEPEFEVIDGRPDFETAAATVVRVATALDDTNEEANIITPDAARTGACPRCSAHSNQGRLYQQRRTIETVALGPDRAHSKPLDDAPPTIDDPIVCSACSSVFITQEPFAV